MNQEPFVKTLVDLGFTSMDAQVYFFLAKKGNAKGKEILNALKINRQQVYRSLKSLQRKGIVSSTFEHPARFSAIPFDKVLDMFIKTKMEETQQMQQNKAEILSKWQSIELGKTIDTSARFMVIQGRNHIHSKIFQIINDTKSQLLTVSTVPGLVYAHQCGFFDAAHEHPLKSQIHFRILTELSQENVDAIMGLLSTKPCTKLNFQGRDVNSFGRHFPRFVIKDEEELIFFMSSSVNMSSTDQEDTGIWTNSKAFINAFKALFEELWLNSTDIQKKMVEIKTGRLAPETCVIKSAEVAYKKYIEIMSSARVEIMSITSPEDILRFWKKVPPLKGRTKHGLAIRIMTSTTNENLKAVQELSEYCEIRQVATHCLRTTVVDGIHLFIFKTPSSGQENIESSSYFEDTFYTNDLGYTKRSKYMLNDIWQRSSPLSTTSFSAKVSNSDSDSKIAETMEKKTN